MVEFDNGAIGTINSTRFATGNVNRLELNIYCDKGAVAMKFDDPITQGNYYSICTDINASSPNDEKSLDWEIVKTDPTPSNYERFIYSIKTGKVSGYNDIGQVMFKTLIQTKKKSEILKVFKRNIFILFD